MRLDQDGEGRERDQGRYKTKGEKVEGAGRELRSKPVCRVVQSSTLLRSDAITCMSPATLPHQGGIAVFFGEFLIRVKIRFSLAVAYADVITFTFVFFQVAGGVSIVNGVKHRPAPLQSLVNSVPLSFFLPSHLLPPSPAHPRATMRHPSSEHLPAHSLHCSEKAVEGVLIDRRHTTASQRGESNILHGTYCIAVQGKAHV